MLKIIKMSLFKHIIVIGLINISMIQLEAQNHTKIIFDEIVNDSIISKFNINSTCEYRGKGKDTLEMICRSFDLKGNLELKATRDYSTDYYLKETYENNIDTMDKLLFIDVIVEKLENASHKRIGLSKYQIKPSYDKLGNLINLAGKSYIYNRKNQLIESKMLFETETYSYDKKGRIIEVKIDIPDSISCYSCNKHLLWKRTYNDENRITSEYRESKLYTVSHLLYKYDIKGRLSEIVNYVKLYSFGIPINPNSDFKEKVETTKYEYKNNLPFKVTNWVRGEMESWRLFEYEFFE